MDEEIASAANELLLQNGWDYDERKHVTFMLRNKKPVATQRTGAASGDNSDSVESSIPPFTVLDLAPKS